MPTATKSPPGGTVLGYVSGRGTRRRSAWRFVGYAAVILYAASMFLPAANVFGIWKGYQAAWFVASDMVDFARQVARGAMPSNWAILMAAATNPLFLTACSLFYVGTRGNRARWFGWSALLSSLAAACALPFASGLLVGFWAWLGSFVLLAIGTFACWRAGAR